MAHVFVIKRSNMRKDKIKNENIKENSGGLTVSRQVSRSLSARSATSRICEVDIEEKKEEDIKITINPDEKFNDESQKEDTLEHEVDFENEDMKGKINGTDHRDNKIGSTKITNVTIIVLKTKLGQMTFEVSVMNQLEKQKLHIFKN